MSMQIDMDGLFRACEQLQNQGNQDQAASLYRAWLAQEKATQHPAVLFNYGALLQSMGNLKGAMAAYEECLQLKPGFAQALINLGLVCEKAGNTTRALAHWVDLVGQQWTTPQCDTNLVVLALNHIGRVQENLKNYSVAEKALAQSLSLNPQQPHVIQHWVHVRQKACQWPVYQALPGISPHQMMMATSPLAMLALQDDAAVQLLTAQSFVQRTYPLKTNQLAAGKRYQHQRMRIGYVSGDLCVHAVGLLLAEFMEAHDASQFEIYAYDFSPEDGTAHRARLKNAFHQWRAVHACSDQEVAELVLLDEIDVLIDLHGLSSGARPGIFALHPAPLQGTYLGFMGTTAMPWFDFVITDKHAFHADLLPFYAETKPLMVDGSFIPLSLNSPHRSGVRRANHGLPEDAFLMAAFGNTYKIKPDMFDAWLSILQATPHAVLWLMDDNADTTHNLKQYASAQNADLSRIIFTPRMSHADFKAALCLADVFLDTYPYNCGSTSKDVIDAGVPLVTLCGNTMVSRMGNSILQALDMPELIARTLEEYKDIVLRLARGELMVNVRKQVQTHAPKAIGKLVRSLENGLKALQHD